MSANFDRILPLHGEVATAPAIAMQAPNDGFDRTQFALGPSVTKCLSKVTASPIL